MVRTGHEGFVVMEIPNEKAKLPLRTALATVIVIVLSGCPSRGLHQCPFKSVFEKLDDQQGFADVAQYCPRTSLALKSIEKLTDQPALAEIALNDEVDSKIRLAAVKKLTDQQLLAEIVNTMRYHLTICRAAIKRLDSQQLLAHIARSKRWAPNLRDAAITRLEDQQILADIVRNERSQTAREAAAYQLRDQTLLTELALHDRHDGVRHAALHHLRNQPVLEQIFFKPKQTQTARFAALDNLTAPQALARIATKCCLKPGGRCALYCFAVIGKLRDEQLLEQLTRMHVHEGRAARIKLALMRTAEPQCGRLRLSYSTKSKRSAKDHYSVTSGNTVTTYYSTSAKLIGIDISVSKASGEFVYGVQYKPRRVPTAAEIGRAVQQKCMTDAH